MDAISDTSVLNELLDPFANCLDSESAQRVMEFGIAPAVQQRMDVFAERASEGLLTEDERTSYEALINATDFIAILKLKAERRLASNVQP
jgi:hypothetical protein